MLYVPQFIGLFHRPLRDNALYPPAETDEATLIRRLEGWRFCTHNAAISLQGQSGERGGALSGGQVQKLELARLCAVKTPILILDESTSALDAASEADVISTLRARASGRLLTLVTHKRNLAATADHVIFVAAGQIPASRNHQALMANPAYRSLWT